MRNTVVFALLLAAPIGIALPLTFAGPGAGNPDRTSGSAAEVTEEVDFTPGHRDLARGAAFAALQTAGWPYSLMSSGSGSGSGVFGGVANSPPVCDAGPDFSVTRQGPMTIVTVDGSASYDPDGDPITFTWTACPGSIVASPNSAITTVAIPSFPNQTKNCGVRLRVDDGQAVTHCRVFVTITPQEACLFLIIDEDSIDNGLPPNYFSDLDVNDDKPALAQRTPLRYFEDNVGQVITLWTGTVGDEGWFAPKVIPTSWDNAGPTNNGLKNFLGQPCTPYPHGVGPGLGTGNDPESLLDKVPSVIPLRASALKLLEGKCITAVVWDSDISINYDKKSSGASSVANGSGGSGSSSSLNSINGSLKGENLGTVAFRVLDVRKLNGQSSGSLPEVDILIMDVCTSFNGPIQLFLSAPEPLTSSLPYDIDPGN